MTSSNLYAMLVGINQYKEVRGLNGCVDDITAVKNFLEDRLNKETYALHYTEPPLLVDEAATRDAIIDGFKNHLSKAGKGDVVLFYFCGYGARERAGEEFKDWQLDNAHETIVCYDSRTKTTDGRRVPDLADKELRYLISQVANKGEDSPAHVLVVFDCCHSSSGTRDLDGAEGIRQLDDVAPARKYSDFCFADQISIDRLSPETFPQGDYTFIAACLNTETAKETSQKISQEESQVRGLFTYSLIKELDSQNATLSYDNLIHEVRTSVTGVRPYQNPQLEFVKGIDAADPSRTRSENPETESLAFLGDPAIIKPRDLSFTLKYRPHTGATRTDPEQQEEWIINAGAFQGIQEDMELAVYPEGSKYAEFEIRVKKEHGTEEIVKSGSQKAIARIKIIEVRATESFVEFVFGTPTPDSSGQFPAIVIKRPVPKVLFYFEGEEGADRELLGKVRNKLLEEWRSLAVGVIGDRKQAHQYRLYVRNQQFEIRDGIDNRLLIEPFAAEDNDFLIELAANRVEHIAKWITTLNLENPNSSISKDGIDIEVTYQGLTSKEPHLVLYQQSGRPRIHLKIRNQSGYRLFFTLLDISSDYSITDPEILYDGENKVQWLEIEDGDTYTAKYKPSGQSKLREDIPIGIPKKYEKLTEYGETLKLIASTRPFTVDQFKLNSLPIQPPSAERSVEEDREPPVGDWVTKQFSFTLIRSKPSVAVSSNTPTELSKGISIRVPDGFSANASLKPLSTLSRERSLDGTVIELPRLKDAEAFDLIDRRRGDRNISQIPDQLLSVLELSGSSLAIDKVTPESPIVISSVRSLEPDEGILTLAHDGNFWLPVGYGMLKEDGKTEIEVQHLVTRGNKDTQDGDRKISEAISLCFLKVVVQSQQSAWLRKATPKPDGTVSFTPKGDLESVRKAVAQAERIVLFIHGILGDSENMIPSVLAAGLLNSNGSQEQGKYDLVLAFDYENLNTKIQETANELKEQLKKVGLGNGHKKTLHIIAHSIGGLVSRSFIEQHGGNKVVNHLLMLGTPNGGSQWSSVYQLATTLLSVGLNFIPESFVAGPFVSLLTKKDIEKMSTTLRQMNIQESDLLPELRRSEDPQCPYTIIGGNTQLNEKLKTKADNLLQALEQKVWKGLEFPFKGQSNDIAVTVESIFTREVFEGRNPAVNLIDSVACNHLVYFKDQNGLNALAGAVRQAFELPVESENQSAASTSSSSALQTRTASWFDTTDVVAIGIDDDKNVVPYLGKAVNHAVKTPKIIEQVSPTDNWLNTVETDFVTESGNRRNFITRRNWGIAIGVILGLSGLTIVAINRQRSAEIQAIRASIESSEALMASNQTLDARIASLRAGRGLQELSWQAIWPEEELKDQVRANLQHVVADEGNIVPWRFVGNIDQLLSINCAWVRDYLEHNPNVVERDRRLCDGVPELKQVAPQISTIPSSALSTLTPQGFPPAPKANAEDYYTRGNEKANSKYLENFPKIIAKSSTNAKKADAYVNRGVMHFRQKKYAKAIEDYTKAIALAPNNANAYINRGIAYSSQGNHERAIKDYNEALNIDTKNADAGVALSGDDNPAQKSAKGNLSNHPASGQNSDAYINRGIAYSSQGRHEWAIKDYDEALKIAPDSADAYYAKGFTLALIEGKKQEAIDNYRTAADLYRQEKKPSYYENTLKKIEELKRDRQGAVRQPE